MSEASSALIAHHADELPMKDASSSSDIHNSEPDEDSEEDINCSLEPPPGLLTFTRKKNVTEQHTMEDTEDTERLFSCQYRYCDARGSSVCTGCKMHPYCSVKCQKADWEEHRRVCLIYQPYNALRIIARPVTKNSVFDNIHAQLQPFHFLNYGDPRAEIEELKRELGWTAPTAVGKIYEYNGDDQWHYYVCGQKNFGQRALQTPPKNELASRACGRDIWGDVVVIKTGPLGQDFDVHFSMADLGRTLEFYKTGDSRTIYAQLVRKRRSSYMKMRMEPMNPITEQYMRQTFMESKDRSSSQTSSSPPTPSVSDISVIKTTISICSAPSCSQPAKLRCTGCKDASYCSKPCQKIHWPRHKKTCVSARKHNCFLLCARPATSAPVFNNVQAQVKPFALNDFGTEVAEIKELKGRLGWGTTYEVGEFYDRSEADDWYYFVYGQIDGKQKNLPKNEIASKACGAEIYGDVAIIRSSPVGNEDYPEEFTKNQLCSTLEFYKTKDSRVVFGAREKSRMLRMYGISPTERPQATRKEDLYKAAAARELQKIGEKHGFLNVTAGYF